MGCGRMSALSIGRSASQPGGGGYHPHHVGRGGLPVRPKLPRRKPRSPREGGGVVRWRSKEGGGPSNCHEDGGAGVGWSCLFFSFTFLFAFLSWCALLSPLCLSRLVGKRSDNPARTDHFGLGRDLVKGGKMGWCPRAQRQTAVMALRATCSGIARELITHTHALLTVQLVSRYRVSGLKYLLPASPKILAGVDRVLLSAKAGSNDQTPDTAIAITIWAIGKPGLHSRHYLFQ